MKKYLFFLTALVAALFFSCENEKPEPPSVSDMYFEEGISKSIDEGSSLSLSQYLVILPSAVGDTVTVNWTSSNEEVATVSLLGYVEALRAGTVTITATAMDKQASVTFIIEKVKVKEFTIPATFEVYVGEKVKFPIENLKPKNVPLYRFEWEADNDGKIPTYSEGKWYLKADKECEFTLIASVDDAEAAECKVKFVKKVIEKVSISPKEFTLEEGGTLSLKDNFTVEPIAARDTVNVTWSSSKESVATIDATGNVTAISAGQATITATAGGLKASCTVTVTAKPGEEDPETPEDPEKPEDPDTPMDPSDPEIPVDPEKPTFTITFDANGAEGTMESITVNEGESVTIPECGFTRAGYSFEEWNTSTYGEGTAYQPGNTFIPTEDVAIYAQWKEVYTIKFNVNEVKGVNDGSGNMDDIVLSKGQSVKLPKNAFNLFGGEFISWNTSKDGSGIEYKDQATITPSSDLTLYAQWKITKGKENGHIWVDFGLPSGNKWAMYNIGTTSETGSGKYFSWGETASKNTYDASTYTYKSTPSVLPKSADVAQVEWGGDWYMPTQEDYQELIDNCTWDRFKIDGKQVYTVTSKINGKTIAFVTAGYYSSTSVTQSGNYAIYWTSSSEDSEYAHIYYANSKETRTWSRLYGLPVRAVLKK